MEAPSWKLLKTSLVAAWATVHPLPHPPQRATIQEGETWATGLHNTCESHNMTNKKNHIKKNHGTWFHLHRILKEAI